jgi:hypothetical protein
VGKYGVGGGKSATAEDMAMRTESARCSSRWGPAQVAAAERQRRPAKNGFNLLIKLRWS